jgi:hypothetical protein
MKPLRKKGTTENKDRWLHPPFIPDDVAQHEPPEPDHLVGERRIVEDRVLVCVGRTRQAEADPDEDWRFMAGGWIWVDEADVDRVYRDDRGEFYLRAVEGEEDLGDIKMSELPDR